MPCEQFKTAISEAAATADCAEMQHGSPQKAAATTSATETSGTANVALREHLDACESCRAFYAEEQRLFAAIDAGLSRVANAEPGVSFLPRMRVAIEQEVAVSGARPPKPWFAWWPLAAVAGAVCFALLVSLQFPSRSSEKDLTVTAAPAGKAPGVSRDVRTPSVSGSAHKPGVPRMLASGVRKQSDKLQFAVVLVPSDERDALTRFLAQLQERPGAAMAATRPEPVSLEAGGGPAPLEIALLEVPLLSPEEAQSLASPR